MFGNGLYIALAVFVISFPIAVAYTVSDVNRLKKDLLENYDKSTTPISGDELLNVSVAITVTDVADLDEKVEKLTTNMVLLLAWTDETMIWNETETGINNITFDKKNVWVPECFVENKHSQVSYGIAETRYLPVLFFSNGTGVFVQMITAETYCNLDTSNFPYDRHTCGIAFMVKQFGVRVKPMVKEMLMEHFQPDGSWDVVNGTLDIQDNNMVIIMFTLARKPTFIMVNLIIPMTMLALLSPLVFLLPNQSGERVSFSITVLLAISVFMTIVAEYVPQKSKPFPLVLTMFFISYSLTIVVVICVIINARIYRLPDHVRLPRPLIWLSRFTRSVCCCFRRRHMPMKAFENESQREEKVAFNEEESQSKKVVSAKNVTWKDISWTIDMLCMTLLYTLKVVLIFVFMLILRSKGDESNQAKPHE